MDRKFYFPSNMDNWNIKRLISADQEYIYICDLVFHILA